jgi:hypothetical protein
MYVQPEASSPGNTWEYNAASNAMMEKFLEGMSPKQRRAFFGKADRRFERKLRQAEFRAYVPPKGYRCPRCHETLATPAERLACRSSHGFAPEFRDLAVLP